MLIFDNTLKVHSNLHLVDISEEISCNGDNISMRILSDCETQTILNFYELYYFFNFLNFKLNSLICMHVVIIQRQKQQHSCRRFTRAVHLQRPR